MNDHVLSNLNIDLRSSPTAFKFLQDKSFVTGLMGPVGSGKSFVCAAKVMIRAVQQKPSPVDGIRYTRFVIVRNSYPELKTTTLKTWADLFPENIYRPILHTPPITHHIKLPPRGMLLGLIARLFSSLSINQKMCENCCHLNSQEHGSMKPKNYQKQSLMDSLTVWDVTQLKEMVVLHGTASGWTQTQWMMTIGGTDSQRKNPSQESTLGSFSSNQAV